MKTLPGLPHLHLGDIYCIGRNYVDHAKELNNPVPEQPVVFTKPKSSVIYDGGQIIIPDSSKDVHHEGEIVVALQNPKPFMTPEQAANCVAGIAPGIDVTARDVQQHLKEKSLPWDLAKGLNTFTVLGKFVPVKAEELNDITVKLSVNGQVRQLGSSSLMIFPIAKLISFLSSHFNLQSGDLIFTGTPKGVASLTVGDQVEVSLPDYETGLTASVA